MKDFINDYLLYHAFTIIVIVVIISMIIIHHYGSKKNEEIAKEYQLILNQQLKKSFKQYDGKLIIETPNIIKLYFSGRESCLFGIIAFALVPRHQIISFLFNSIFIGLKDQIVIEVPIMNPQPVSMTMVIIRKSNIKMLTKKKYPDIKQLCKQYKPILKSTETVPDSHSILVQKVEHYKHLLFNEEDLQVWREYGKNVKMVYMSDYNRYSRYPMTVRMVMSLSKDILPLFHWLLRYIDRMSKLKMTAGQRKEAHKRRQGLQFKPDY